MGWACGCAVLLAAPPDPNVPVRAASRVCCQSTAPGRSALLHGRQRTPPGPACRPDCEQVHGGGGGPGGGTLEGGEPTRGVADDRLRLPACQPAFTAAALAWRAAGRSAGAPHNVHLTACNRCRRRTGRMALRSQRCGLRRRRARARRRARRRRRPRRDGRAPTACHTVGFLGRGHCCDRRFFQGPLCIWLFFLCPPVASHGHMRRLAPTTMRSSLLQCPNSDFCCMCVLLTSHAQGTPVCLPPVAYDTGSWLHLLYYQLCDGWLVGNQQR